MATHRTGGADGQPDLLDERLPRLATVNWNSRLAGGDIGDGLARLRSEYDGDLDVGGLTLGYAAV